MPTRTHNTEKKNLNSNPLARSTNWQPYRCPISRQTLLEEYFNVMTHRLAFLSSIAGFVVMVTAAAILGGPWHIVATSIFCLALCLLFLASVHYHGTLRLERKQLYRVLDHVSIFLVIAGSYTPFMLVLHDSDVGWTLFWVMWGAAAAGIVFKLYFTGRFEHVSTLGYLAMGWACAFAIVPLRESLPTGGFDLLIASGLSYTVGTIFYSWKKLPFNHVIWHLFVMGGVTCSYFSVMTILMTMA